MIGRLAIPVLAFCVLALLFPPPIFACSTAEGYRTPSNFELVDTADLIVLARVVDGSDDPFGSHSFVAIEPVKVLKGVLPGDPLRLFGGLKWNGRTVPSMPTPLATSHFSAGLGACIRLFYPKGGLLVAMFRHTNPSDRRDHPYAMMPMFQPFARATEDVESADGVWVKAVETYVSMQEGRDAAHLRNAAERKRAELAARTGDVASQAIAADLADYLDRTKQGASPPSPGDSIRWRTIDLPEESAALVGSTAIKARFLRCRAGGGAVEAYWPEEEGAVAALRIGERRFALTPAKLTLSPDLKAASATAPFDPDLRDALLNATVPVGLEMPDRVVSAPPLDMLQKFALRCEALLSAKEPR